MGGGIHESSCADFCAFWHTPSSRAPGGVGRMYRFQDRIFEALFSRMLVYTILFEDNERDLAFLSLGRGDRVFSVAGAGCGVAAMLGDAPSSIDVVDFNAKHLAITALKVEAARQLPSYEEFHMLFGRGNHPRARSVVQRLTRVLPTRLTRFWRSAWKMFEDDFHSHGLYTKNLDLVRRVWPITPAFLKQLNGKPPRDRAREMFDLLSHAMKDSRVLAALIRSPLSILAAGINYTQRERNLRAVGSTDVVDGVIEYATRVVQTDLEDNWIAWHIATGRFNHEREQCLPLFLRREQHARALGSPTDVRYVHDTLFSVLRRAADDSWSHFCLSDVLDWISDSARGPLLRDVYRTAKPGARVICRTVEDATIVGELGLAHKFRLIEPFSTEASRVERSCLYRRVNCYEVVK